MKKLLLPVVIIGFLFTLFGCATPGKTEKTQTTEPTAAVSLSPEQRLVFEVVASETPGFTSIPKEELGGNANGDILYSDLSEVNLRMDGAAVPLGEAVRKGELTLPELFAFARMDAQNGFCEETYVSQNGLTHFSYTYPQCVLSLAYDVYETPDGKQTLIEDILVSPIREKGSGSIGYTYVDPESEWGYFIDREDWGLTFVVSERSPTGITLEYSQQGGQQIGELFIVGYTLCHGKMGQREPEYIGRSRVNAHGLPISIQMNTSGQIVLDWTDDIGTLKAGVYNLQLSIADRFGESEVHPLMVDYYDKQGYWIEFSVE